MMKNKNFSRGQKTLKIKMKSSHKQLEIKEKTNQKNFKILKRVKVINEISRKNDEANKILLGVKKINDELDTAELVCTQKDGTKYDFNHFLSPLKFVKKIYNYEITPDEAIEDQEKLEILISRLKNYKIKK